MSGIVFDVIVAGAGTMGSFACLELARRGVSVLGIDRFTPPHDRGSHSGATRIFREAYAEGPEYVSLARHAGRMWDRFGEESGAPLLKRCGMLSIGPPDGSILRGVQRSAAAHGLPVEQLSRDDVRRRYGCFDPPPGHVAMFDPRAGYVDVDRAIGFSIAAARHHGAEFLFDQPVERWDTDGRDVHVHTAQGKVIARALVIAAGAWSASLLPAELPLQVLRRALIWVDPLDPAAYRDIPVFMFQEQSFYGFPMAEDAGVKVAVDLKCGGELSGPAHVPPPDKAEDAAPVMELAALLARTCRPNACRAKARPQHQDVPLHDDARCEFHHRSTPGARACLVRSRFFRARFQVRAGHRSRPCRPRAHRFDNAAHRFPADGKSLSMMCRRKLLQLSLASSKLFAQKQLEWREFTGLSDRQVIQRRQ